MHARISIFLFVSLFASFAVASPTYKPGNTTNHLPAKVKDNKLKPAASANHTLIKDKDKDCTNTTTTTTNTATSMCNTGTLQCCSSTQTASSSLSLLNGLPLATVIEGLIGIGCSPILPVGTGSGGSCTQEPVCCSGDTFGGPSGILNLGCSPINAMRL